MKLSIDWIFDHIEADWRSQDIPQIVSKLNQVTAEIEDVSKVLLSLDHLAFAQVTQAQPNKALLFCPEWKQEIELLARPDMVQEAWFLVVRQQEGHPYRLATTEDLGGQKPLSLSSIAPPEGAEAGKWRKEFLKKFGSDYILDIDNKSITHRPDLWGHRGFAREIAAILGLELKDQESFLANVPVNRYENNSAVEQTQPFEIKIQSPEVCSRFAGMYIEKINQQPSTLEMATRLARADVRPIDLVVDVTNYVMLDFGHPMHAFDAHSLTSQSIEVRTAKNKEQLTLLDDREVGLCQEDIVIANGGRAISLAGVMGGKKTEVKKESQALFLEAACFDATSIRKTAARYKARSEASARFEKSLDPESAAPTLLRALALLQKNGAVVIGPESLTCVGPEVKKHTILLSHDLLQARLGVSVDPAFVAATLEKLAFDVKKEETQKGVEYHATVPTFRATKDVTIQEDVIEEVARYFGYENITPELPKLSLAPTSLHTFVQEQQIKQLLAFACNMKELHTYSFYDESFLKELNWQPEGAPNVQNPVSENWQRLLTTLLPNMLQAVIKNSAEHDELRFFESARAWEQKDTILEQKTIAGIWYQKHAPVDFYDAKEELAKLFNFLGMHVRYERVDTPVYPWLQAHQTAHIYHDDQHVGFIGVVPDSYLQTHCHGHAAVFELNGDVVLNFKPQAIRVEPISKYPEVMRDISMMVPLAVSAEKVEALVGSVDERITQVSLVDFFHKKEWGDQKALTVRFELVDHTKTLTKDEVDEVWQQAVDQIKKVGAQVR